MTKNIDLSWLKLCVPLGCPTIEFYPSQIGHVTYVVWIKKNNNQGAPIKRKSRQNNDAKIGLTNNKQKQNITFFSYKLRLEASTRLVQTEGATT